MVLYVSRYEQGISDRFLYMELLGEGMKTIEHYALASRGPLIGKWHVPAMLSKCDLTGAAGVSEMLGLGFRCFCLSLGIHW